MKKFLSWALIMLMLLALGPLSAVADVGGAAPYPVSVPVSRSSEPVAAPAWTLSTLGGQTINERTYANKTQLLIFYRGSMDEDSNAVCPNSRYMVSEIANAYWRNTSGLQVILVESDGGTAQSTSAFINAFGAPDLTDVVYAYGGNDLLWQLWELGNGNYWVTFCVCAVIQGGQVKAVWDGSYSASQVGKELSNYIDIGRDPNLGLTEVTGQFRQTEARKMLSMINDFRTGNQAWYWNEDDTTKTTYAPNTLGALTYDPALEKIAMQRAAELAVNYSHTRPNGESVFSIEENGVTSWGENIAYGYNCFFTSDEVFVAWREDEDPYAGQGHRRNMLYPEFTTVGFGCFYQDGFYFWTQEFGMEHSGAAATAANNEAATVTVEFRKDWFPNQPEVPQVLTGWQKVGGKWYYYNDDGALATGWQKVGGKWYYLDPANGGVMKTGWLKLNNKWYYLNASGVMQTGWLKLNNKWYYLNASGVMQTGWQTIGGKKYYFNASGVMQTGLQKVDGKWYYFESSGALFTTAGWKKIGTKWYYFNSTGVAQTGWLKLSGKWYYLDTDASMVTGWKKISNKWYYFESSGVMLSSTTRTINGKSYTFNVSGACTNP